VSKTHPIVLVCGASDYDNARAMERVLDTRAISLLIIGDRPGVDRLARHYAIKTGMFHARVPALKQLGEGPARWQGLLLALLRPDLVLAFREDDISQSVVAAAHHYGIRVEAIRDDEYAAPLGG
jgi:hypothetical protein